MPETYRKHIAFFVRALWGLWEERRWLCLLFMYLNTPAPTTCFMMVLYHISFYIFLLFAWQLHLQNWQVWFGLYSAKHQGFITLAPRPVSNTWWEGSFVSWFLNLSSLWCILECPLTDEVVSHRSDIYCVKWQQSIEVVCYLWFVFVNTDRTLKNL